MFYSARPAQSVDFGNNQVMDMNRQYLSVKKYNENLFKLMSLSNIIQGDFEPKTK